MLNGSWVTGRAGKSDQRSCNGNYQLRWVEDNSKNDRLVDHGFESVYISSSVLVTVEKCDGWEQKFNLGLTACTAYNIRVGLKEFIKPSNAHAIEIISNR